MSISDLDFGREKMEIYVLSCDGMFVGVRVWVMGTKSQNSLKSIGVWPLFEDHGDTFLVKTDHFFEVGDFS